MKTIRKFLKGCRGSLDITGVVVDVALAVALIPVIVTLIAGATDRYECLDGALPFLSGNTCYSIANFTGSSASATLTGFSVVELALVSLITLIIVIALVFMIVKQSGLKK